MSTATEHANELFMRAALSDDNLGYPNRASFLAADSEGVHEVIVCNMLEGTPTVIVTEDGAEHLLFPVRRSGVLGKATHFVARRFGRIPVVEFYREAGASDSAGYADYRTVRTTRRQLRAGRHAHAHV